MKTLSLRSRSRYSVQKTRYTMVYTIPSSSSRNFAGERYQEPRFAQPGGSVRASPPSLKDLGCRLDLGARGLALRTVAHQGCRSRYALIAEKTATTRSGVRRFFLLPPRFPANHTLSVDLQSATCFKFPLRKLFRASGMHLPAAISQVRTTTLGISEKRWNGSSQCRGERGGG